MTREKPSKTKRKAPPRRLRTKAATRAAGRTITANSASDSQVTFTNQTIAELVATVEQLRQDLYLARAEMRHFHDMREG